MNTDLENPMMEKLGKPQDEKLKGLGLFSLGKKKDQR